MTKKPGCELWSSMHGKICFVFTLFDKCSEVLDHIYNNIVTLSLYLCVSVNNLLIFIV